MDKIVSKEAWGKLAVNVAVSPSFLKRASSGPQKRTLKADGGVSTINHHNSSGHGFDHHSIGGHVTNHGQKFMSSHLPARFVSMK